MKQASKPTAKKTLARPHNCYNIFFLLERERLLQSSPDYNPVKAAVAHSPVPDVAGYGYLDLPDFPTRYKGLVMQPGWYVPGRNSNRKHVKSHGLATFHELAKTIASNWKQVDPETRSYCEAAASIIKERHSQLTKNKKSLNGTTSKKYDRRATMPTTLSTHEKEALQTSDLLQQYCRSASMPYLVQSSLHSHPQNQVQALPLSSSEWYRPRSSRIRSDVHSPVLCKEVNIDQLLSSSSASTAPGLIKSSSPSLVEGKPGVAKQEMHPNNNNKSPFQEVDISDSDIRNMWTYDYL